MREIQGIGIKAFERALYEGKIESGQSSRVLVEIMAGFVIIFDLLEDGRLVRPYPPSPFDDLNGKNDEILANRRWMWVTKDNPKRALVAGSDNKITEDVFEKSARARVWSGN